MSTGWKVGYCIAPPGLSLEFRKVHQYNVFCTFAPAQHAFAEMLREEPEHYLGLGAFYQAKRDAFRTQLAGTRLRPLPVPGGYFQLVDYSEVSDLVTRLFSRGTSAARQREIWLRTGDRRQVAARMVADGVPRGA